MSKIVSLGLVLTAGVVATAWGCAAGKDAPDGTSGQGGVNWSSASSSGQGGAGAAGPSSSSSGGASSSEASSGATGGQGGSEGQGGAAASVSSTASSSSASSAASSGAGGSPNAGTALLLAGGDAKVVGASLDGGIWTTKTLAGGTNRAIGLRIVNATLALGVYRETTTGALTSVKHDGAVWGVPTAVAAGVTTQGAPAIALRGTAVDVVFHGDDFKYYFASYAGAWAPTAELVKPLNQEQSFGPAPGALAALGQELVLAFPGGNGTLYHQSRVMGAWQGASAHAGTDVERTPAMVALDQGAELLGVYARKADKKLMFAVRKAGVWSAPTAVEANSYTDEAPGLTALPGGEAYLVFRGTDGKPYTSWYQPSNNPPWSAPKAVAAVNPTVLSPPSVAPGIDGHVAELAYVGSDGKAYHASFDGTAWSAPTSVAGPGLSHVALATSP